MGKQVYKYEVLAAFQELEKQHREIPSNIKFRDSAGCALCKLSSVGCCDCPLFEEASISNKVHKGRGCGRFKTFQAESSILVEFGRNHRVLDLSWPSLSGMDKRRIRLVLNARAEFHRRARILCQGLPAKALFGFPSQLPWNRFEKLNQIDEEIWGDLEKKWLELFNHPYREGDN